MGARISVQFENGKDKSVVLFSHWGGEEFAKEAKKYVKDLKKERGDAMTMPIDRLEPNTVMVDFIREITHKMPRVESDLYLGVDSGDGDNSDYGHHLIKLK